MPMHVDVPPPVTAPGFSTSAGPPAPVAAAPGPAAPNPPTPARGLPWVFLIVGAVVLVLLVVVAVLVLRALFPAAPLMQLPVSGRLEGYQSDLGAKTGGRIASVAVREGAVVRAGQVLVQLDDAQAHAQAAAAAAAVVAAEDRAHQAQATIDVLASQIDETSLGGAEASADTNGRVAQARGNAAAARAQVAQAAAVLQQAEAARAFASADQVRYDSLSRTGDISLQRAQQADTAYRTADGAVSQERDALAAARRNATAAIGALSAAQSTSFNAPIQAAQGVTLERQQNEALAQIAAANADANQARAVLRGAQSALSDLTVRAPSAGTVIARAVEPGDVVAPGRTLLSIVDLDHVYLRGYVPEGEIGRVRVGQAAHVFLDSAPKLGLDARVGEIDAQASFTPENVYFQQDRVEEVFGVRLDLRAPRGYAKPGMPADALIDLGKP
jgi:HlyD family secretion protein